MSRLRDTESVSGRLATSDETVLWLVKQSVARRRSLIYGTLHDGLGGHCAMGCLWEDHPGILVNDALIDEVATVNDSVPRSASPKTRWKTVSSWLRWKLSVLATEKAKRAR